ncbi:MAG: pyridoxamine 5'-phosphate oxidase [Haliscomenobacter sp.]|nr:pyridoxamine 5'-phosphate oxidase [Haliscomenobacter sp.]MBK7477090.1 pyridoxamine 5'-phosphate oxidase [Haliscomenobacter sp.]MBK8878580.1 pyridoxamine 5'-phosphate oxidase [Haliscomenobacter sp.]
MDLSLMRQEFVREGLSEEGLRPDPISQFEFWFQQAMDGNMEMANAMSLSTVSAKGQPSLRTVLLKFFDRRGFVFYTNFESRKSREISENPQVALLFPWLHLERQVVILGKAEKVGTAESVKYFLTRPRGSQIGAWCSNQSSVINSRQMLMAKFEEMKEKFHNQEIPLPSFWGGYRVVPHHMEFWQGRENRLHDRFLYLLQPDGSWTSQRLAP